MNDAATIQTTPAAEAKLARLLTRLQSELGKGAEEAVKWAAYYVARSLGASTKRAPKKLRLYQNTGRGAERWPVFVERYRNGVKRRRYLTPVADIAKETANRRAGLAAQSWLWIVGDLGNRVAGNASLQRPANAVQGIYQGGINPTATLQNRLRYIEDAVRHGGPRGVETAMERGATAGLRYIDRRAQKAMQS